MAERGVARATVRAATAADTDALVTMVAELNLHQGDTTGTFDAAAVTRDLLGKTAVAKVLVAMLAGTPVGYAILVPTLETSEAARGLYLSDLWVRPDARRRGIARMLVAAAAAESRASGGQYLWWVSKTWNADAHAFYRSLGAEAGPILAHTLTYATFTALADEAAPPARAR